MKIDRNVRGLRRTLTASAIVLAASAASPILSTALASEPEHHAPAAPDHGATKAPAPKAKPAPAAKAAPTHSAPTNPAPTKPASTPESAATPAVPAAAGGQTETAGPEADEVMNKLSEGNERWTSGKTTNPHTDSAWRSEIAKGQHPFVTVLTCADSRLPVERIFDQGAGDVFVVRVAGNVAGGSEVGTIEYGVGHLKTPVLVVMGHTKCGAVAAAAANADVHGKLAELVDRVKPSVERAKRLNPGAAEDEIVAQAIKENVWQTVYDVMKQSSEIREAVENGHVRVVGAICDISTGKVEWMGEHPWQSELMAALRLQAETTHAAVTKEAE